MDGSELPRTPTLRVTSEQARKLPNDPGHPSVRVMAHGSMEVRWFVPRPGDEHLPHDRDEVYFVAAGSATFCRTTEADPWDEGGLGVFGEERVQVAAGDVLFVPAGARHKFSAFTPDFGVWAVFYGPEGGERE